MKQSIQPVRWSDEQLECDINCSIEKFRESRLQEPLELYEEFFERYRDKVEDLIEGSLDLSQLDKNASDYLLNEDLLYAIRYLASPPISKDDLETLANVSLTKKALDEDSDGVSRVVGVIKDGLDRNRFPWVAEDRPPSSEEKSAAVIATTALIANRRAETKRRSQERELQEGLVGETLKAAGLAEVAPSNIENSSQGPRRGEFCHEAKVAGRKADIIVRLWDGRLMPCECKVSNSFTNSIKRLNNDAAVKAEQWIHDLGTSNVVPCAVLAGVFKLNNVRDAQGRGLYIFWDHALKAMTDFIGSTK